MNIIVVYNSKTGFTKRYAEWIAEELKCRILPYQDFSKPVVEQNDIVIFGSRVHAGKIEYLDKVKGMFRDRPGQSLIVFATGATPAAAENAINKIWADNFTETESIPRFYLQSGLNYEKMGVADRTIMKGVAKLLGKKKDKNEERAGFEAAIRGSYDSSSKDFIAPLTEFVQERITDGL